MTAARVLTAMLGALLVVALWPSSAYACPVCFGAAAGPMAEGANNGILFLLGVIGVVQFGFVALFVGMWRRSYKIKQHKESLKVISGDLR